MFLSASRTVIFGNMKNALVVGLPLETRKLNCRTSTTAQMLTTRMYMIFHLTRCGKLTSFAVFLKPSQTALWTTSVELCTCRRRSQRESPLSDSYLARHVPIFRVDVIRLVDHPRQQHQTDKDRACVDGERLHGATEGAREHYKEHQEEVESGLVVDAPQHEKEDDELGHVQLQEKKGEIDVAVHVVGELLPPT